MNNKKKIIILFGPPGVGKGTIANFLHESSSKFKHVSLGSICREYALEETELGFLIKKTIDKGNLIDLSLVEIIINKIFQDFIASKIDLDNQNEILILDGFPRTFEQTALFLNLFNKYFNIIDFYIILLYADLDVLKKRLANRYICSNVKCDKIYSSGFKDINDSCIKCNSNLYQRKDDEEDIISYRLLIHKEEEIKIINCFNEKNINFFEINGNNKVEDIIDMIYEIIYASNNVNNNNNNLIK